MGFPLRRRLALVMFAACLTVACTTGQTRANDARLISSGGTEDPYREVINRAPLTVFVFVAAKCPCLDAHFGRLKQLLREYSARGVQFVGVDSEVGTTPEVAASEARALTFPVLLDRGAKLADAFGAEYATYAVIVDRQGRVVYRGGIDSDKRKLHDDATPYVREALDDLLSGKTPRRATGRALGCTLRKW
ncbi:MAG: redoxin domain-containing protein [Myxococcales bacterium]|nr:redoxin domain-containing protein [Myxococcales bacterium]